MIYSNFTIRLRDWNRGRFLVEVVSSPVGRMAAPDESTFLRDVVRYLEIMERPRTTQKTHYLDIDDLTEFGQMLGDMLFPQNVRRMLQKSLAAVHRQPDAESGLRIVLQIDAPFLRTIPWEYAYLWEYQHIRENKQETKDLIAAKMAEIDADPIEAGKNGRREQVVAEVRKRVGS
ncbi:MAG: hypothetical protein MJB57_14960, partial [Gemmatimonadetes bacterium]|nr:hypothetical protein [Gemmatimonadota bacterium]